MKKVSTILNTILLAGFMMILCGSSFGQVPQGMNYQAIARNAGGNPWLNRTICLRLTIHSGTGTGPIQYQETQVSTTNTFGLFTLKVGMGTVTQGTFNTIPWSAGNQYLQVEMDSSGACSTWSDMGASELLTVPYAMYAGSGGNGPTGATGAAGTNGTNGATGATGAPGINGTNGATGATGNNGINGTNGATGATGATGPTGVINGIAWGITGNTGTSSATNFVGTIDSTDFVIGTNNNEKARITGNGNVGIGTSTPQAKLDVESTSFPYTNKYAVSGTVISSSGNLSWPGGSAGVFGNITLPAASPFNAGVLGTVSGMYISDIGGVVGYLDNNNWGALGYRTSGAAYWGVYSNTNLYVGGLEGIGTTTPLNKLDVNGGVAIGMFAGNMVAPYGSMIISGTIGIGNAAPTQALDVSGNVKFSGALMPNNLPGTTGQVLLSAGANNPPTWGAPNIIATSNSANNTNLIANGVVYNYTGGAVTITVPRSGTIVVQANADMLLDHVTGTTKRLSLDIGTSATDGGDFYSTVFFDIPSVYPTVATTFNNTFTVRRSFTVAAGTYTYYLNGAITQGASGNDNFNYCTMQAIFY